MRAAGVIVAVLGTAALGAGVLAGCAATAAADTAGTASSGTHAAAATAVVSGRLVMEGGPIAPGGKQPPVRPLPGTVSFTAAHRRTVRVAVPASGRFTVRLAAGTYRASATTPNITGPGGKHDTCPDPSPVRVTTRPVHVVIACIVP
jgi:hypothetical protein